MNPDFSKYADGLLPVIVQDSVSQVVLMLGFMNQAALDQTTKEGKLTFYSRSKERLWTKGESSGHFLFVKEMRLDCDADTLLVKAAPAGPVRHTGADTCFDERNSRFSLSALEQIIAGRKADPSPASYTSGLFAKGINAIAQKVGEEAVELVIESKDNDREKFLNEAADLMYHFLVLLQEKDCSLKEVETVLEKRSSK